MTTIFKLIIYSLSAICLASHKNERLTIVHKIIDAHTSQAEITIHLKDQELLYKNRIEATVDHPAITVDSIQACQDPIKKYDHLTKQTVTAYTNKPSFIVHFTRKEDPVEAYVHLMYHVNTDGAPAHSMHKLTFTTNIPKKLIPETFSEQPHSSAGNSEYPNAATTHWSWYQSVSQLVEKTQSVPLRLLFVFLLGLLLSFTPCIYPMIPITVGILHAQKSSSVVGNFARASSYTLGLATTFSLFGLAASYTGPIYGKLLVHPVSVTIIVSLLAYMALSMMGFYELSIPRFLQASHSARSSGTLLSAFLLGTASGTIASPCVSPGLILLLSIVATMGSMAMGFLFLFTFGIGLSVPLLMIGTFSSSLSLLPQAGMWMVEIKKMFGLLLFAVCFYYLSALIPWHLVMLLAGLLSSATGFSYLLFQGYALSARWKFFNNILGMILISGSILLFAESYQAWLATPTDDFWETNYTYARNRALKENKKIFIDFWARYCSICKKINNSILADAEVRSALKNYIPVKIDGTDESSDEFQELKKKFTIIGYPAFMIIDPQSEKIISRWSSELHTLAYKEFIQHLMDKK